MLTFLTDRNRISNHFKACVTVNSDTEFDAFQVRATKIGEPYMLGVGYDLLCDDLIDGGYCLDGTAYVYEPATSLSFDIESSELENDGEYRISVYVRNTHGTWNDVCPLYTKDEQLIVDSNSAYIFVQRLGFGTDDSYTSAYAGEDIAEFISEVLKNE